MRRADHIHEPPLYPPEEMHPRCPSCGEECETFYRADSGEIVGCEHCIDVLDAWEEIENDGL